MLWCPKPIVVVVRGYAVGISDLMLAGDDAVFGQTSPRMGSFDAGYGSVYMSRLIRQKRAKGMRLLCRFYETYEA